MPDTCKLCGPVRGFNDALEDSVDAAQQNELPCFARFCNRFVYDGFMNWRNQWQTKVHGHLLDLQQLRAPDIPGLALALQAVQDFQSQRLASTYADLLLDPGTEPAARFFLDELYCPASRAQSRDADVNRIVPIMSRMLPRLALEAIGDAVELDLISAGLDLALAQEWLAFGVAGPITVENYAQMYRIAGQLDARVRQIELVTECGDRLAKVVKMPLISPTLAMMEMPARAAGLQRLHQFLHVGFAAFKHLPSPQAFIDTVRRRETALMRSWLGD